MLHRIKTLSCHRLAPLALPVAAAAILTALGVGPADGLPQVLATVLTVAAGAFFKVGFGEPPRRERKLRVVQ